MRACSGVFETLVDRWGLLISAGSIALAHAALGDWAQAAFALGVADSLSERIGGRPFQGVQAAIDAVAAKTVAELGAEITFQRQAGMAVGRGEHIAAALGAAKEMALQCPPQQQEVLTPREHEIANS